MICGNIFAVVGNAVAATSTSVDILIAANAFNGIAAAVQISFSVAIAERKSQTRRG